MFIEEKNMFEIPRVLQSCFQLKVVTQSSFCFSFRFLNTHWGCWRGSYWNGKLPVEKICWLFVHKVGKNLSLGHGGTLQKAQILYPIGHYLHCCFLLWSHWCCHHWTTLQGLFLFSFVFVTPIHATYWISVVSNK